ncbi:MAG: polyamine aminopropyltransferase [Burkholderiales bacterium]|nr:polyamine aminopropyltransferase [Burkholderiales bacterium]
MINVLLLGKWRIERLFDRDGSVDISEKDGVRYLHLGSSTVQSAMRLSDPVELVLSYTRAMMGFLMFIPAPSNIAMIGLGGGSLVKFIRHHMPSTRIVVVENNPRVITVARSHFEVPEDGPNFSVVLGDGEKWVAESTSSCDVLMVDGYNGRRQDGELATEEFYTQARNALSSHGVLVVNLWSSDRQFDVYLQRLERTFGWIVTIPAERRGNMAVLASARPPKDLRWSKLKTRARQLETAYGLEFTTMLKGVREFSPFSNKGLRA